MMVTAFLSAFLRFPIVVIIKIVTGFLQSFGRPIMDRVFQLLQGFPALPGKYVRNSKKSRAE
jgi:hypothetical protein